jgi:hypothetical protein
MFEACIFGKAAKDQFCLDKRGTVQKQCCKLSLAFSSIKHSLHLAPPFLAIFRFTARIAPVPEKPQETCKPLIAVRYH